MTKVYFHSHFSGGGGAAVGALEAGCELAGGIELRQDIARLYKRNLGKILVGDIAQVKPLQLKQWIPIRRKPGEILITQTSPECKEFSDAKQNKNWGSKSALLLNSTWRHYSFYQPEYVVLENVRAYLKSEVYQSFKKFLANLGYSFCFEEVVDCSYFGVPQSRKRLILIAVKNEYPPVTLKPTTRPLGWHEAIEDLLSNLTECELTEKQRQSYEYFLKKQGNALISSDHAGGEGGYYSAKDASLPSFTISANTSKPKAVIIERLGYRDEPKIRHEDQPLWTLKAHLADDGKGGSRSNVINAVVNKKVVALNTRCLARLQGFPDWYKFSGINKVDVTVIGNSVPPPLMKEICLAIKQANSITNLKIA